MRVAAWQRVRTEGSEIIYAARERAEWGDFTENDLIRLAGQERIEGAFEELFHRHKGHVHALALRLTGDPGSAEEVTLETFVAAWNGIPRFRAEGALSTWLCGIAVNRARQRIRSDSRRRKRLSVFGAAERTSSAPPDGVDHRIDLERAVATLPDGARTAVLLRHVHGLSYREVADAMSVSVGTAKSQVSRGCSLLREYLG